MSDARSLAHSAFIARFGREPEGIAFAPGRVNLIGEHVDYNDGLVLPMPLSRGTAVAYARRASEGYRVFAADADEEADFPSGVGEPPRHGWQAYCDGMIRCFPAQLHQGGLLAFAGDLPRGAGLSSSASLCIAIGRALATINDSPVDPILLAKAAQRTEHEFVGVACGIMDQMAVAAGEPDRAMLLDCRDLSWANLSLPPDWRIAIFDSGVRRGLVDGEYNVRRRQCESAAGKIRVASLRDATLAMVEAADLDPLERQRARHVVTEIARTRAAASAIEAADLSAFGALLNASHASLRDDFAVSVPGVDRLVAELQHIIGPRGGARMTGAGFGGAVVAAYPAALTPEITTRHAAMID